MLMLKSDFVGANKHLIKVREVRKTRNKAKNLTRPRSIQSEDDIVL